MTGHDLGGEVSVGDVGRAENGEATDDAARRQERLRALLSIEIPDAERRAALVRATGPSGPTVDAAPEPAGVLPPQAPARPARGWRSVVAGMVLVGLFVAGLALTYSGARVVRSSTQGEVLRPVNDPQAPGYEALVDSTPTMVVMHDRDGVVDAITVLTLPSPDAGGGGVVLVPTRTVAEVPIFGLAPISSAYDLGTPSGLADTVGDLLGAAMGEFAVVDDQRWADLVAPVAPLMIDNPDHLVVDGDVVFPLGRIALEAGEVGTYLHAATEGESDLARLYRHRLVWRAWLAAVGEDGSPQAVPGEVESGLGRFVRTLATGDVLIDTLPVRETDAERYGDRGAYLPENPEVRELVHRVIPFPRSPSPGARARVRVLNGTTDTSEAAETASALPPAGVEIVLVGNATEFGVQTTQISYFGAEHRPEAQAIREILGVGEVTEETRPSDVVDITVTLGADYE